MKKVLNIFLIILILIFFFTIYNFYSSKKNMNEKKFNRNNINKIIKEKISDLPVLENDTNNIIEFNNSISRNNNYNEKPRSFWQLLKSK
jgi:hypothetical protein